MALDFPSSPTNGQVYDNFYYDAAKGTWKSLSSGASPNYLVNPTITNAVITATASTPSTIPLTVNGAASQSANLQEWKNSAGINLAHVSSTGVITTNSGGANGIHIKPGTVDHGYISYFARTASPNTRSAYIGFGTSGSNNFTIANEIANSQIILSSSYIKMPNQPSFCARGVSNPTGTRTVYLFDQAIDFNVGSNYNSSTGRFTAPVTGIYFFEFHLFGVPNTRYAGLINKNGTALQEYTQEQPTGGGTSNGYGSIDGKIVMSLAANDYVTVSGSATVLGTNSIYSSFSGYLIG